MTIFPWHSHLHPLYYSLEFVPSHFPRARSCTLTVLGITLGLVPKWKNRYISMPPFLEYFSSNQMAEITVWHGFPPGEWNEWSVCVSKGACRDWLPNIKKSIEDRNQAIWWVPLPGLAHIKDLSSSMHHSAHSTKTQMREHLYESGCYPWLALHRWTHRDFETSWKIYH